MGMTTPVAEHEYHVVELEYPDTNALEWCFERWGQADGEKWFSRNNKIFFYDTRDHMMFLLRWS